MFNFLMFFLVDTFSKSPFLGNPAGVCILDDNSDLRECFFQEIAAYFNWSEISFIKKIANCEYQLRWFSPLDEAPLCGHATLGAAHILFTYGLIQENKIKFIYKSGSLFAEKNLDNSITLSFPLKRVYKCENPPFIVKEIIGIEKFVEIYSDDTVYIIALECFDDIMHAVPNFEKIKKINCRAITITATGFDHFDFVTRYFAPSVGIYEDPVCGSTHCRLAHYWSNKLNKNQFTAFQASKRTGILKLSLHDETVNITGDAVTICRMKINDLYRKSDISRQQQYSINSCPTCYTSQDRASY